MHSPWLLSLGRPRRQLRAMATATEGARVGRQGPTVGRVCLQVSSMGGGAGSAPARIFDDLRIGRGRSWRGIPLALSFRRGFL
jgi:hypothetical protein